MQNIKIIDITLKTESRSEEFTLSFKEKLEIAKLLDKMCVDVIEVAPIADPRPDALLIRTIASTLKYSTLSLPVGLTAESVREAWEAIKGAAKPRLCVAVPVSPLQMEYVTGKKPEQILEMITELVSACKAVCSEVDFSAEDAVRAEPKFLAQAIGAAVAAGATTVTVCDSEGNTLPDEFYQFIQGIYETVPALKDVNLAVQCVKGISMSTACTIMGVKAGAIEVKATVTEKTYPAIENLANVMRLKGDTYGICCGINYMELQRITSQISRLTHQKRKGASSFDRSTLGVDSSSSFTLDSGSDLAAVRASVQQLGYSLSEDDTVKVYDAFQNVAAKKDVGPQELDAIVASVALQVPATYKLVSYVINSGNIISATAHIQLQREGETLEGFCLGDGPIDAAFLTIEQIVGRHFELDDFQIQAVTEGREAMGSALIRLRANGKLYAGNGISTDIIGASINAYINALNKIVYEEGQS